MALSDYATREITATFGQGVSNELISAINVSTSELAYVNIYTAIDSIAIGVGALSSLTSGPGNIAIGSLSLGRITSAFGDVALGYLAARNVLSSGCTAIGYGTLIAATAGTNVTAVGSSAGAALTTGTNCTFLGATADTSLGSAVGSTALGYGAILTGSHQVVLGTSAEAVLIPGSLAVSGQTILNNSGSALATNATSGFTYLPTCAGTPSGVPATLVTGAAPMVVDTTGGKLWTYYGGAWHFATLT